MSAIFDFIQQQWVYALGWTILHSLWQSSLIAGACAILLFFTKQETANFRCNLALTSIIFCVISSVATYYRYMSKSATPESATNSLPELSSYTQNNSFELVSFLNSHINTLTLLWLAGFVIFTIKTLLEYRYCQHIKNNHLIETPEKWQLIFVELCRKVGVKQKVDLRISEVVQIPCVIGYVKPVVLIPLGLLLRMNQLQIEAILLHELGHVRRNDYLIALFQAATKSLFFFNPFILWISNQLDKERENACDDIAVNINQNPLLFANTLKEFAELNINQKPALSIHHDKLLLSRITRLFAKPKKSTRLKHSLLATILIVITGGVSSIYVNADNNEKTISINMEAMPAAEAFTYAITQINLQCHTNEKLEPLKHSDGIRMFNMSSVSCSSAIDRMKSLVALENIEVPKDGKLANININNQPVYKAMAEVNKQCATNAPVSEKIRDELASFSFVEIPCEKLILFIQSYVPEKNTVN